MSGVDSDKPKQYVTKNINAIQPLVEADEPFIVADIDVEPVALKHIINQFRDEQIVKCIGERQIRVDGRIRYRDEYVMTEWARNEAERVLERSSFLPCGHRAHIANPTTQPGYTCRHCRDKPDDKTLPVIEPSYDKTTVKEAL